MCAMINSDEPKMSIKDGVGEMEKFEEERNKKTLGNALTSDAWAMTSDASVAHASLVRSSFNG